MGGRSACQGVTFTNGLESAALPRHHDDTFDRMLIAQARVEKMRAVSADKVWRAYDLDLVTLQTGYEGVPRRVAGRRVKSAE